MTHLAQKVNTMPSFQRFLILIAALTLGLSLGACGQETASSETASEAAASAAPPAPAASAQTPVDGDAFVFASIGEPSNLIPPLASDSASGEINNLVYDGLMKVDGDLNIVPQLAERLEISDDGLTFTFHLRRDVRWHDGTPYSSRDALFTYRFMADPQTPTAYGEPYRQVKSAEAPDDYTFRVTYERPLAKALISWCMAQLPAHLLEGRDLDSSPLARHPIGTGPYKFESWEAGQRLSLTANDDYFQGRPHLDKVVMRIIPDLNAQMMELLNGGLDNMALTPDQYDEKKNDESFKQRFQLFEYPAFAYTYLGFNLKNPLFGDRRVRQALAYAIDKDEIVEGVLLGLGTVANGPFPSSLWAHNAELKPYPFDPQRARQLLSEAGWADANGDGLLDKDGQTFSFTIMTNQGNKVREQTALLIQARLKEIGVELKLRVVEWAAFIKNYLEKRDFEAVLMAWTVPMEPDLYDVWNSGQTKPEELNFISYANPEVDSLIDVARFSLDRTVRKKAYDRIQELLHQDAPYVFLFVPYALPVYDRRFSGPEVTASGVGHNFNHWYVPLELQRYGR